MLQCYVLILARIPVHPYSNEPNPYLLALFVHLYSHHQCAHSCFEVPLLELGNFKMKISINLGINLLSLWNCSSTVVSPLFKQSSCCFQLHLWVFYTTNHIVGSIEWVKMMSKIYLLSSNTWLCKCLLYKINCFVCITSLALTKTN